MLNILNGFAGLTTLVTDILKYHTKQKNYIYILIGVSLLVLPTKQTPRYFRLIPKTYNLGHKKSSKSSVWSYPSSF